MFFLLKNIIKLNGYILTGIFFITIVIYTTKKQKNCDHKKWSLERYSDHLVTTKCGLRKSRHKDKLVTKWSQSVTTRNMVTDNDHYNVVTDL